MSLSDKLARLEKSHRLLLDEILQAGQEAERLEEENRKLKIQLGQVAGVDDRQIIDNGERIQQTAWENMEKLYQEGFHICHLFFGREKNGECLFCQGLLGK